MASEVKLARRGALGSLAGELAKASSGAIRIEPLPFRGIVNLRGRATREFSAAIEAEIGIPLPLEPNRWAGERDRAALWLGPDEWLLMADDGGVERIDRFIRAVRPEDPWLSVTDVSHSYTGFTLSGPRVRDLLAGGCALDLHPAVFTPGSCAQTLFARTQALLHTTSHGESFELLVRNSFAGYMARWLLDASAGFPSEAG